ncbi:MAG: cupin domain-containing protein [Pseudomonadales bacterium]
MEINADFNQRVVMHGAQMPWVDSPMQGVQRRMLDRIGDEVARATSIVRYAPGSHFSPHVHTGGEEFLVLDGVFQDEHGDFPAGSYIRNPPESRHTPGSEAGCTIFVKLWQFDLADRTHVRLHIDKMPRLPSPDIPGVLVTPLYEDPFETVQIEYWPANSNINFRANGGSELLVLEGGFTEAGDELTAMSWLRTPPGAEVSAKTADTGAKIWRKHRHLTDVKTPFPR